MGRWVRAFWRRNWISIVALALLTGFASGVVLTAVAGARRTSTSFERLRVATRAYDHFVVVYSPFPGDPVYSPALVHRIEHLPAVGTEGEVSFYTVWPIGRPSTNIQLGAPADAGVTRGIERPHIVRGRLWHRSSVTEVVVNEAAVRTLHADVGSTVHVMSLSPTQLGRGDFSAFRGPRIALHVVGVTRDVSDVEGEPAVTLIASPAFDRANRARVAAFARVLFIRRRPGITAAQFHAELDRVLPSHALGVTDAAVEAKPARKAVTALGNGLLVFALVAGAASFVAVSQAVARLIAGSSTDQPTLEALGTTRAERAGALVIVALPIAAGGAALAAVSSTLASALMPVGLAGRIEPAPGIRFDPLVTLGGALAIATGVAAIALVAAIAVTRPARSRRVWDGQRPWRGPRATPVVDVGTRLAFDHRPPALPVRSSLLGVTAAVLGLVGALTFSSSLDRFVATPSRWGFGWDLNAPGNLETASNAHSLPRQPAIADAQHAAHLHGVVASAVLSDSFTSYRGTNGTLAWGIEPIAGHIEYVLRSGAQPVGADEMVVGPQTAKRFHFHVGDTVPVDDASGGRSPVRIVGIALFPALDSGTFNDAIGFSAAGFARHVEPDSVTRRVVVNVSSKRDEHSVEPHLARIVGNGVAATSPIRPGDVDNLESLRRFPVLLALFTAMLGFAAIGHVVVSTTRRRRHDLATLRSLGLTPRQAHGCLVWQALTIAAVAVVVGVPSGVVAGARAWQAATQSLGTATDALCAPTTLAAVAAGTLLVAAAIAAPAGWRAARARPASALHTE